MKLQITLALALFVGLPPWVSAQPASQQTSISQLSRTDQSQIEQARDERLARDWGLGAEEWTRYEELMDGLLGIY